MEQFEQITQFLSAFNRAFRLKGEVSEAWFRIRRFHLRRLLSMPLFTAITAWSVASRSSSHRPASRFLNPGGLVEEVDTE